MTLRLDTLPMEILMKIAAYLDRTDLLSLNHVNGTVAAGAARCLWSSVTLLTDTQLESVEGSLPRGTGTMEAALTNSDAPSRPPPVGRGKICHVTALELLVSALNAHRVLRVLKALGTQLLSLRLGLGPDEAEGWMPSPTAGTATPAEEAPRQDIVRGDCDEGAPSDKAETAEVVSAACVNLRELEIRGPCRVAKLPNEVCLLQAICRRAIFLRKLYLENVRMSTEDVLFVVKNYPPGQLTDLGLRPVPVLGGPDVEEDSGGVTTAAKHGRSDVVLAELRAYLRGGLRFLALVGWGAGFLDLLVEDSTAEGGGCPRSGGAAMRTGTSLGHDSTRDHEATTVQFAGTACEPGLPLLRHLSVALFHPSEVEYLAKIASQGCLPSVSELTLRGMPTWGDGQVHLSQLLTAMPQLRCLYLPALRSGSGHILSAIMPYICGLESLIVGGPIRTNPALFNLGAASAISNSGSSRTLAFVEFESAGAGDEIVIAALVRGCPNLTRVAVDYPSWSSVSPLCSPPPMVRSPYQLGNRQPARAPPVPHRCHVSGAPPASGPLVAGLQDVTVPSPGYSLSPTSSSSPSSSPRGSSPMSWEARRVEMSSASLASHACFVSSFANSGHDERGYQISGRNRLERTRKYGEQVERLAVREKEEHIAKINSEHKRKHSRQKSDSGSSDP